MSYLIVIPARGGSKSLLRKNIQSVNGKPLICWTISEVLQSNLGDIVVTTEDVAIKQIIQNFYPDLTIIDRPPNLAQDDTPLAPVILDAYLQTKTTAQAVITLQPTSPLRKARDIIGAVERFEETHADSLLSVTEDYHSIWERKPTGELAQLKIRTLNRQFEAPLYIANGAIFITKSALLLEKKQRLGGKIEIYVMPQENSIDIHTKDDVELAEFYFKKAGRE